MYLHHTNCSEVHDSKHAYIFRNYKTKCLSVYLNVESPPADAVENVNGWLETCSCFEGHDRKRRAFGELISRLILEAHARSEAREEAHARQRSV